MKFIQELKKFSKSSGEIILNLPNEYFTIAKRLKNKKYTSSRFIRKIEKNKNLNNKKK